MTDEKGPDEKVICVPLKDPAWMRVHDIHDIPPEYRDEIEHFFQVYKDLEEKKTETRGFGNRAEAEQTIVAAARRRLAAELAAAAPPVSRDAAGGTTSRWSWWMCVNGRIRPYATNSAPAITTAKTTISPMFMASSFVRLCTRSLQRCLDAIGGSRESRCGRTATCRRPARSAARMYASRIGARP